MVETRSISLNDISSFLSSGVNPQKIVIHYNDGTEEHIELSEKPSQIFGNWPEVHYIECIYLLANFGEIND